MAGPFARSSDTKSETSTLAASVPIPPAPGPATPPAAGALDEALAASATLAPALAAAQALADPAARREALRALAPAVQALSIALARLEASAAVPARAEGAGDALTGLADRAELAAAGIALGRQYPDTPLMVLAADIDHLRHVNDAWSQATGDAVLRAVAGVLRAQSRPQDVLARADGNLFVVALGGPVSTTRALLVAERLRAAIEAHAWDGVQAGLRVTASIGVAARAPGESLDDVLARTAAALQECKRGGRNQVRARS